MSKKAREIFERHAKAYNVNTVRGQYGELLDSKARECWYFFFSAWKARARDRWAREVKAKSIKDKAHEYMERANKRFRAKHQHKNPDEAVHCEFCNGHSWGAVDGYIAGYKAEKRR